ncbi:carboxypeptidase-like regulatory domain-containing protein [Edaphobacter bradus]|uniref:carboxypeptidase-like regulatory domain-containing protein n=1 Tax=Edaphobacter bradus TaxID=2259016 RepID=UPI0021E08D82|nr:carboxypeptidase-like regulatory domain-containing protein [Edaphobacter bradus]
MTDASGAAIPGATITATQIATATVRTTVSSANGIYVLSALPIGPYKLRVAAQGFETYIQTGITLQVNESPKVNITLNVGQVTEQVVVNSEAAMVQTDTTSVSQVIDQARMTELPLNGRQPTDLIMLAGGATDTPPRYSDLTGSKNYSSGTAISVFGGQSNGTNYLLDGGENIDTFSNVNLPLPFPDALQEFSVETSSLSARYGSHPGAVVNAVTKSGTNQIHGSLFEFVRNGAVNAANAYSHKVDPLKRNQFGGTVGGPILRGKVFGFFGLQETVTRTTPSGYTSYLPTQAVLNGDFSTFDALATNGGCQAKAAVTLKDPNGGTFAGNKIPTSRFNQQALNLVKHLPMPTDPCGKLVYSIPQPQSERQILGRVDTNISARQNIFGHYFSGDYLRPGHYSDSNILLAQVSGVVDHSKSIVMGDTYTISPTIVNSAHLGYTRLAVTRGPAPNGINLASLGVNIPYQPLSNFLSLSVPSYFSVGCGTCSSANLTQNNIQLADDMDIVRGRQHISLGVEWVNHKDVIVFWGLAAGQFGFSNNNTGDALADFMLGLPRSFTQANKQRFDGNQNYFGAYVHDVVQFNKRLTAQLGVRWEPNLWGNERANRMQHFDMAAFNVGTVSNVYPNAPAGLLFPGDKGVGQTFAQNHPWKFEPRAGISWDPTGTGHQIIRAGYGLFYDVLSLGYWEDQTADAPWGYQISLNNPVGGFSNPWAGYPGGSPFPTPQPPSRNVAFPAQGSYITYPSNMRQMYTNQWNLMYEIQPFSNWVFSAGYVGNKTIHVLSGENINASVYAPGSCPTPNDPTSTVCAALRKTSNSRRALYLKNPALGAVYSDINQADDNGIAGYNGLLLKGQHRFSSNYTILANYTYSHCLGNAEFSTDFAFQQTQDPNNLNGERGNCSTDIRHIANISFVGVSPALSNRLANTLVGRWKLSPIVTRHSGTWFTPSSGFDYSLTNINNDRPNLTGNPYQRDVKHLTWLTATGFTPNAWGTFGNVRRNSVRGPGWINVNVALSREFAIREQQRFEFRFEAFNLANHANYNSLSTNLSSSSFGKIQGAADPRILQIAGKFTF